MPTDEQLRSEIWYLRETDTVELDSLADRLRKARCEVGTRGDNNHVYGGHRSQAWVLNSRFCTDRSNTVIPGLSGPAVNYIAALDWSHPDRKTFIQQCKRVYDAVRAGLLDGVTEFFGNINGDKVVDGWDNIDDTPASADSSHLDHGHITFDRRRLTDPALMTTLGNLILGENMITDVQFKELLKATQATGDRVNAAVKGLAEVETSWSERDPDGKEPNLLGALVRKLSAGVPVALSSAQLDVLAGRVADQIINRVADEVAAAVADVLSKRLES